MAIIARIVFLAGLICLSLPLFFPLWKIQLEAPQYPEGLGMYIHCDKITGYTEYDLENINLLNHYIGMARIEPESIPELKYMKYIIYGALSFGLLILILGKKLLVAIWWRVMIIIGAIGVYDFNEWEKDYGYNLDPRAPIKIEGMSYKPPLLGSKQLLNITAKSYPSTGGVGIALSVALAFAANILLVFAEKNKNGKKSELAAETKPDVKVAAAIILFTCTLQSCSTGPDPIVYGQDECSFCRMKIIDRRYGAEIVTTKGKVYKFDSFECLVDYSQAPDTDTSSFQLQLTTPFDNPGTLTDATKCGFLVSQNLPSPMGAFITSFTDLKTANIMTSTYPGDVFSYKEAYKFLVDRNLTTEDVKSCCENNK